MTVGGAVAADVHGKNHHRDGSFASCLVDFHLALPSGDVLRCARDENPDVFWATVGGMGLTGTIVTARLQLRRVESAFVTVEYEQTPHLEQTLALFAESDARHCYSVAWIDCLASGASLGRSVVIRGDHTPAADVPEARRERPLETRAGRSWSVPFNLPQFALNPWTVKAFNSRFYARHRTGIRVERYDRFFYPLDAITNYFRLYGRRGFMQYQAVFPRETSRAALPQMLRKLSDTRSASFLAVLKSTGPGNEGMLSFPMAGHTLALDMPYTPGAVEVAKELDRIVLAHDGRVYLAKNAFLTPDALRRMYPRLPEFLAVKGRLDPGWRVRSSLARRLGLVGGA